MIKKATTVAFYFFYLRGVTNYGKMDISIYGGKIHERKEK